MAAEHVHVAKKAKKVLIERRRELVEAIATSHTGPDLWQELVSLQSAIEALERIQSNEGYAPK
jgi:hypothetical protein